MAEVSGEFAIGGLFNHPSRRLHNLIYAKWNELSPALKSAIESIEEEDKPPILHAAILAKAPLDVIQNILSQFEYSILKQDSLGRHPIEIIALEKGLGRDEELSRIEEAIAKAKATISQLQQQQTYMHYTACEDIEPGQYYPEPNDFCQASYADVVGKCEYSSCCSIDILTGTIDRNNDCAFVNKGVMENTVVNGLIHNSGNSAVFFTFIAIFGIAFVLLGSYVYYLLKTKFYNERNIHPSD